jgi:succinate-acetate transporter protein
MSTKLANPAPLGLMGFGMTTILLNIHNAGFFPIDSMILAMGIFYGGLSQVIVGIMCFNRGDTFGTTAFTSYGLFWLTLVGLIVMPKMGFAPSPAGFMGCYLALWGIFTGFMFIGSLCYPVAKQVVFGSLTILFALLAIRDFTGSELIGTIAGFEGIFCGASAVYFAMAQVLNAEYGRVILPVGAKKPAEVAVQSVAA